MLKDLSLNNMHPWLVCGDFNEIFYAHEKIGGALRDERRMYLFRETFDFFQLKDVGSRGNVVIFRKLIFGSY